MPFISNEKRQDLIEKTNSRYTFRKTFLIASISFLILMIAIMLLELFGWIFGSNSLHSKGLTEQQVWIEMCKKWWTPFAANTGASGNITIGFSPFGFILLVLLALSVGAAITSVVFVVTFKSPKMVKEDIKVLEGSPLSGKSTENLSPIEIVKERRKPIEEENK